MNCPKCRKYFDKKQKCVDHINRYHAADLDQLGWNAEQWLYASAHGGSIAGKCQCGCGRDTEWNYKTGKPFKVSTNPECKKRLYQQAEKNMQKARGVSVHSILNDMEHQKMMQEHRPTHGVYTFTDGGTVDYLSKLELNFLKFCDKVMEFTSNMFAPCPTSFPYYDPKTNTTRQYMPDYYLPDYNLIVEIKDGRDQTNTNPAFIEETKYKVALKDEVMKRQKEFNYIRISGANYTPFVELLYKITHEPDPDFESKKPKNYVVITEAAEVVANQNTYYMIICRDPSLHTVHCIGLIRTDGDGIWYMYDYDMGRSVMRHYSCPEFTQNVIRAFEYIPNDTTVMDQVYDVLCNQAYTRVNNDMDVMVTLADNEIYIDDGEGFTNNAMRLMSFRPIDSYLFKFAQHEEE